MIPLPYIRERMTELKRREEKRENEGVKHSQQDFISYKHINYSALCDYGRKFLYAYQGWAGRDGDRRSADGGYYFREGREWR